MDGDICAVPSFRDDELVKVTVIPRILGVLFETYVQQFLHEICHRICYPSVCTPSTSLGIQIFRHQIPSILNSSESSIMPVEFASLLVDMIFKTLPIYEDRGSRKSVDDVIIRALRVTAFMNCFAATLVQTMEKHSKFQSVTGGYTGGYRLLKWSCLLLIYSQFAVLSKNSLRRVAQTQASVLHNVMQGSFRLRRACTKTFFHLFTKSPDIYKTYLEELKDGKSQCKDCPELIFMMLAFLKSNPALFDKWKDIFLDIYVQAVLNAREKPSKDLCEALLPLITCVTHDDFKSTILPSSIKMLKRNPELVLDTVGVLLQSANLDLSKYAIELLSVALPRARHADKGRRLAASDIVRCLSQKSSSPDAVMGGLTGSEGRLTFPYLRVGMNNALREVSEAPKGNYFSSLLPTVCELLLSCHKDDDNEEVKLAALSCLAAWGVKSTDHIAHNTLSEVEIQIFHTPEGMLSTEKGVYVAESVVPKNVWQGRFKLYDNDDSSDQLSLSKSTRRDVPNKEFTGAGKKDAAKSVKKFEKGKTAKEEAQDLQLKEESCVRENVMAIKQNISLMLKALGEMAFANPIFTHNQLPSSIIERILLSPKKTGLHDDVLQILFLHMDPILPLPRVLYHAIGIVPAYHKSVGPALNELCLGLGPDDVAPALYGVYAKDAHSIAGVAEDVWGCYLYKFGTHYSHDNYGVRVAAAEALAATLDENPDTIQASDEETYVLVREGVVIFTGALAKHLSKGDPKVHLVVEKLLDVLNNPSEAVQRAVSTCLSPLMQSKQEEAEALTSSLLAQLMKSDKYNERRGSAFGLAGVVTGSLKKYTVTAALRDGLSDRNSAKCREGALLAFECFCENPGRLFEPYEILLLPLLLVSFSNPVVAVRESAEGATSAMVSKLSAQGVKLVLPSILKALLDELNAPSEALHRAVSTCLSPLMKSKKDILASCSRQSMESFEIHMSQRDPEDPGGRMDQGASTSTAITTMEHRARGSDSATDPPTQPTGTGGAGDPPVRLGWKMKCFLLFLIVACVAAGLLVLVFCEITKGKDDIGENDTCLMCTQAKRDFRNLLVEIVKGGWPYMSFILLAIPPYVIFHVLYLASPIRLYEPLQWGVQFLFVMIAFYISTPCKNCVDPCGLTASTLFLLSGIPFFKLCFKLEIFGVLDALFSVGVPLVYKFKEHNYFEAWVHVVVYGLVILVLKAVVRYQGQIRDFFVNQLPLWWNGVVDLLNQGWNAIVGLAIQGWNAIVGLAIQGWNAMGGLLNEGSVWWNNQWLKMWNPPRHMGISSSV